MIEGKKILMVDNNWISFNEIREFLEAKNFVIFQIYDLKNLNSIIISLDIDLIILNQNKITEDSENIEVLKSIKKPILILNSVLLPQIVHKLKGLQNINFIVLPKTEDFIINKVNNLLLNEHETS